MNIVLDAVHYFARWSRSLRSPSGKLRKALKSKVEVTLDSLLVQPK